jgi:hypothetical protein
MKKIFSFGFAFGVLFFPCIKGIAQAPKLNNAFNYSSGIMVDSKGNAFVTGKMIRSLKLHRSYIRKLTPDGIISRFCKHSWNPKMQQYEETD